MYKFKKMKKNIILILTVLFVGHQAVIGQNKKFTFSKVSRDVKKEAKKFEKEGYKVFPGSMPISQQLNNSYTKQNEIDEQGFPKWIVASGSSVAETQAAAEYAALQLAQVNLATIVEANIRSAIEIDLSNNQINSEDATSITKVVSASVNKVVKKLGMVTPLLKIYRPINKNTEVQLMVGYNYELVKKQILSEMKAELQLETDNVRKKNEEWLNTDPLNRGKVRNFSEPEPAK